MTFPDPDSAGSDEDHGPYRLFGPVYWAALAFVALCLTAAATVTLYGPTIWPRHRQAATPRPANAALNRLPSGRDPR